MSLYQCEKCGCVENTALGLSKCISSFRNTPFCWTGMEELEGSALCSLCAPKKYRDGTPTKFGEWHNVFERTMLPLGMFKTNEVGNLEHIETGETDYRKYEID